MTTTTEKPDTATGSRLISTADHYSTPLGSDGTPHDYYEALRDEAEETPIAWSEAYGGHWVVAGYHAAVEVVGKAKVLSNSGVTFPRYETGEFKLMMAEEDDPTHKMHRRLVAEPFSPTAVERFTEQLAKTTNDLIDERIELGEGDIAGWLANEIPGRLTAILLGIPPEEGDKYRRWTDAITNVDNPDEAAVGFGEMVEHARELIEWRKDNPGDDVMSTVVQSEIDGVKLSDEELVGFFAVLLLGGIENTSYFLATSIWRLAWDKDLRRRLKASPELMPTAIDELMRFYSPAMVGRLALQENITVGDVTMKEGQTAFLWFPVANRDRSAFTNPDTLTIERSPNRHLALGQGIHRCLGAHLIKMEAQVTLTELLKRIPEFELDREKEPTWSMGQVSGFKSVPIVFPKGKRLSA